MWEKRLVFVAALVPAVVWGAFFCKAEKPEVVVYTSVDQVFSEPILSSFEKNTGIQVRAVYDVEASKTTGLVNRLLAERENPKCDVFWNSEFAQTIHLKKTGCLSPYRSPSVEDIPFRFKDAEGAWAGFAARARVLIYNRSLLNPDALPRSIFDLTSPGWKGRVAMAYPLFGTTATHMAALFSVMGEEKAREYLVGLKANDILIVDGNSVARDVVVEGEVPLAFTDTDDVEVAVHSGKPVGMVFPDEAGLGTLLIPNTVAMIKGCPHPGEARRLIDTLLSRETESRLSFCEAAEIPVREGVPRPSHVPEISSLKVMEVNYGEVAENVQKAALFCRGLFGR